MRECFTYADLGGTNEKDKNCSQYGSFGCIISFPTNFCRNSFVAKSPSRLVDEPIVSCHKYL